MMKIWISIILALSIFSEIMLVKKNSLESNIEKFSLLIFTIMTVLLFNLLINESNGKKQSRTFQRKSKRVC